MIALSVSDLSVLICNTFCCKERENKREKQHNGFWSFFKCNIRSLPKNRTWHDTLKSARGWGFNCPAIFNHCRRPGWRQATDEPGLALPCHRSQPTIQDDKCHCAMLICFPEKPQPDRLQEYTEPLSFLQAPYCKGQSRRRIDKHFISILKHLFDLWCGVP